MRIVAVIDLLRGLAVHAQGGCRQSYRPLQRIGETSIDGDPEALARAYVERLGLDEVYVADLDAIAGGAEQDDARARIAATGASLWVDAGVNTVVRAKHAIDGGAARVVVGLETLPSLDALRAIVEATGPARSVFSLDVRGGRPITSSAALRDLSIDHIVRGAAGAGVGAVIVLDVARVGTARGPDFELLGRVRQAAPGVPLLAGGGVRDVGDVRRLADAGCDGVLMATALHGPEAGALVHAAAPRAHSKVTR